MKLGFYFEAPIMTGLDNVNYCTDTYMLLLPKLLNDEVEISIIAKTMDFDESLAHYLVDSRISVTKIGPSESIFSLIKSFPRYLHKNSEMIDNYLDTINHLVVVTGSPLALVFISRALKRKLPCTLLVRANARKTIPKRYTGIKKILAHAVTNVIEFRIDKYCAKHNMPVVALGKELFQHYSALTKKCVLFASSKYLKKDIVSSQEISIIDWESSVKILFVGRLVVNKGLRELITALKQITLYDWTLNIVGSGEYEEALVDLINKLNLNGKIELSGNVAFGDELNTIYRAHDIIILPSYFEGLPQVVLEGMANGCLVLATNVGGIPGVVTNEHNGFLFEPRSTEAIVKTLNMLPQINDLKQIRVNALKTAMEYAQENQINNFYKIL